VKQQNSERIIIKQNKSKKNLLKNQTKALTKNDFTSESSTAQRQRTARAAMHANRIPGTLYGPDRRRTFGLLDKNQDSCTAANG